MLTTALLFAAVALSGAAGVPARENKASHVDLEDANLDVPELVRKYGYPLEVHDVTTSDGYILQMHRIPHGRDAAPEGNKPVVFLMHGLLSSSADWVIMGPDRGLAYILADEGFDVWMGNARGNYYSRRHVTQDPERAAFWNFSWDEIGVYDLPAMIDYALALTGKLRLNYVGHSQGTTAYLVMMSLVPEYNTKVNSVHLMAPVAFMHHFGSAVLADLARHASALVTLGSMLGISEMFPRNSVFEYVDGKAVCKDNILSDLCEQFIVAFASQDMGEFDEAMLPVILGHTPSGSALKQFGHYGQSLDNLSFRRWNFPLTLQNNRAYGTSPAPEYDLSAITAKVKLHYSLADTLAPADDVVQLNEVLPSSNLRRVSVETFTHFDFVWGKNAKALVFDDIISSIHDDERL